MTRVQADIIENEAVWFVCVAVQVLICTAHRVSPSLSHSNSCQRRETIRPPIRPWFATAASHTRISTNKVARADIDRRSWIQGTEAGLVAARHDCSSRPRGQTTELSIKGSLEAYANLHDVLAARRSIDHLHLALRLHSSPNVLAKSTCQYATGCPLANAIDGMDGSLIVTGTQMCKCLQGA